MNMKDENENEILLPLTIFRDLSMMTNTYCR